MMKWLKVISKSIWPHCGKQKSLKALIDQLVMRIFPCDKKPQYIFSNFSCMFLYSNNNYNCSNLSYLRNLQQQVKTAFCYRKLFWPFTVRTNCSNDLKMFTNSRPSASNFKKNSRLLEQFFLTVGQNNFGNKILFLWKKFRFFFLLLSCLVRFFFQDRQYRNLFKEKKVMQLTMEANHIKVRTYSYFLTTSDDLRIIVLYSRKF